MMPVAPGPNAREVEKLRHKLHQLQMRVEILETDSTNERLSILERNEIDLRKAREEIIKLLRQQANVLQGTIPVYSLRI